MILQSQFIFMVDTKDIKQFQDEEERSAECWYDSVYLKGA